MKFSPGDIVSPRDGSIWIVLSIRPYMGSRLSGGDPNDKQIEWSTLNSDGVLHENYVIGTYQLEQLWTKIQI